MLRVPAPEEPGLVARGVSPWNANGQADKPRRGDRTPEAAVYRPYGALLFEGAVAQGLAPLATDPRPSGTSAGSRVILWVVRVNRTQSCGAGSAA